jgi:phosphoglycerate dehydrogenase-like enzyme
MGEVKLCIFDPDVPEVLRENLKKLLPAGWQLSDQVNGASVVLTENKQISGEDLKDNGADIKCIIRLDTGKARIETAGIPVIDISNTGLIGVCEHVVTLVLALSRQLLWVAKKTNAKAWLPGKDVPIETDQKKYTFNWIGLEPSGAVYNKSIGILGMGHIGRGVAKRLKPFGMKIYYYDVYRLSEQKENELGIRFLEREELLKQSDFVSIHYRLVEGKDGNEKGFGEREFSLMKPSAYFINTARGKLVDEDALVRALQQKRIAGAGLDVFHYEPLPKDHPLLEMAGSKVIITPHVSGTFMDEAWVTTAQAIVDAAAEYV